MVLVLLYCSRPSNMWRRLMVLMVLVADQRRVFPLVCWPFAAHPSECKCFGESSDVR